MSYLIRRVLAKPRLILDEMYRLYGKFASYLRRVLCKTHLIFPRINGPIVIVEHVKTPYMLVFVIDKKAACFDLGGYMKTSLRTLLECELDCCTGNNCKTQIPTGLPSAKAIKVFTPSGNEELNLQ